MRTKALKTDEGYNKWKLEACYVCLSQERNLYSLGDLVNVYWKVCRSLDLEVDLNNTTLCWECLSHLKNIKLFQEKLLYSYHTLSQLSGDEQHPPRSLSNLAVSEVLTFDTFEQVKTLDDFDIDEQKIKIEFSEDTISQNDVKSENNDEINNQTDTKECVSNDKIKKESKKAVNYPKERKKRYEITYQSLKLDEAVKKIAIDNNEVKKWLDNERNSEHYKLLKNKCDICLQKLRMDEDVSAHKKKYHTVNKSYPYICAICSLQYAKKMHLRAHIKNHYYIQHCNICGYECSTTLDMRYHLRKCHHKSVVCVECGKVFRSTRHFYRHLKSHQVPQYYFCDQCDKKTKTLNVLEKHIKSHHMTHRCEECDLTFKRHTLLLEHNKIKHTYNPTEESFCVPCNKQFNNVRSYKKHLLYTVSHMAERGVKVRKIEVPCPICHKIYRRKETMMNHYRWVHTKDSMYRCEQCKKPFLNRTKYKDHMMNKHLGEKKPKDKICTFCQRGFATNQILRKHVLTHTGERPHSCPYCEQRFTQKGAMQKHVKTLHAAKHK